VKGNPYETDRYLHEYLLFHYGKPKDLCPFFSPHRFLTEELLRFHERIDSECMVLPFKKRARALDLGCGVGRFAFQLSRGVGEVIAIDNSRRFIDAARAIAKQGAIEVQMHESGAEFTKRRLTLPKCARPARVHFQVGDAQNLGSLAKRPFDVVAAINLICRLPSPAAFLRHLPDLVLPGGCLVIASPFSWLKEYTPRREWLTSADVQKLLAPYFRLELRRDIPFVIREHSRKYQLVVSEVLNFKRLD
jgi:putative 4-mercaptohistidine N1-methyltranferase